MKRVISCAVSVVLSILLATVSFAESKEGGSSRDLSVPTEISGEARDVFDRTAGQLVGVGYAPVAFPGKAKSEEAKEEENWPQSYLFSSGAGGWATEIYMKDDWSFTGSFHDSDMGSSSEKYPDGTLYYCDFSGEFSVPALTGTCTYKMHLNRLEQEGEKDEEHIDNEIRYICWEPYGLQDADEFILYAPGAPVSALTEDCLTWVHWYIDPEKDEYIPEGLYIIYNEKAKTAFVGTT